MRRLVSALLLLLASCGGTLAYAQQQPRPRWDVWRTSVDQFGVVEVRAPRVLIEAMRADLGARTYRSLRLASVPPNVAAPTAAVLSGVLPHAVGVATKRYPFDAADWLADAWIAGGSAYVARAYEQKRGRLRATALYVAGWALVSGWASP
jgi:hypothetical protein